jgi:transmembrane sensor
MEEKNDSYQLLFKFLTEETTREEKTIVLKWIDESSLNKEVYFQVKDLVDHANYSNAKLKPDKEVWDRIVAKNAAGYPRIKKQNAKRSYLKYAAAILIIAAFSTLIFTRYRANHAIVSISTALNQHSKKVDLPDHSVVWLKPGSTLQYEGDFNGKDRNIKLSGEAFFEVSKVYNSDGSRKPFTVYSSKLKVSVLGTSFNLKATKSAASVIVRTGLVKTQSGKNFQLLRPGDRVQLKNNQFVVDKVNADLFAAWTTGDYKFNKTNIQEIIQLLENYSNCQVVILSPDKLKNTSLIGRVQAKNERQLLKILSVMLSVEITKENEIITIN